MAALSLTMVDADGVEKAKGSQANEINKKPPPDKTDRRTCVPAPCTILV